MHAKPIAADVPALPESLVAIAPLKIIGEELMGVIRLATTGLIGYGLYRWFTGRPTPQPAAFAAGEANANGFSQVRNAGPEAMATNVPHWDKVDQASDESFPASDAPGKY